MRAHSFVWPLGASIFYRIIKISSFHLQSTYLTTQRLCITVFSPHIRRAWHSHPEADAAETVEVAADSPEAAVIEEDEEEAFQEAADEVSFCNSFPAEAQLSTRNIDSRSSFWLAEL